MPIEELVKMAKKAEIPEVLEAVAAVISDHALRQPQDEKFDWYRIVHELRELAATTREYEQHFSGRRE